MKESGIKRSSRPTFPTGMRQPLPGEQLLFLTDASFQAAGYAVLTEDNPIQKYTSTSKTYAPIAYGSQTYIPSQIKISIHTIEFSAIYLAFEKKGTLILGSTRTSDYHDR